jgi:hypothetical protein
MTTTTNTGINAAYRQYATPAEIAESAKMRKLTRDVLRRGAIMTGRARIGDYVKGTQYAFVNGRFLGNGHKAVEGRVVAKDSNGRLTIERGDGARFTILADDSHTRGMSPGSIKRYTPERTAMAREIKAARADNA